MKHIDLLNEQFLRWQSFLSSLSVEQILAPNRVEALSIKDVVAHLTAWQKISVARMQAALNGAEPDYADWPYDPDTEEHIHELNAWLDASYRSKSWEDVHHEWLARFSEFLRLAALIPEADMVKAGKFAWLGGYPLAAVLDGSREHHEEHLEDLQKAIR